MNYKILEKPFDKLDVPTKSKPYKFSVGKTGRFYSPISTLKKIYRSNITYEGKPLIEVDIINSVPFFSIDIFDCDKWTKLVLDCELYEYCAKMWENAGLGEYSRGKGKVSLLKLLNSPSIFESKEKVVFAEHFPKVVEKLKGMNYRGRGNCGFANLTQKLEAEFLLGAVAIPLIEEGIPIVTLHDAIFTTEEYAHIVANWMVTVAPNEISVLIDL